jgi:hypothetical protein
MAGKTLPGIGEDESGEHEAADSSGPVHISNPALKAAEKSEKKPPGAENKLSSADKTPARATDRMPLGLSGSPSRTIIGGPGIVDDDKVAEGLKRLRSLDEPLGPIPNTMPTLKEGIPVVDALPAPVPVVTPGLAASEQARTRGTAHGHALSTPGAGQGLVPMAVDDRLKGTLLGHSLHLPDLPSPGEETNRAPEVRSIATVAPLAAPAGTHSAPDRQDFSHGDARFFESDPVNTELEPEHPRSTKLVRGIAIVAAVVSVCIVVVYAVSRSKKSESVQAPPAETPATGEPAPPGATTAIDNNAAPAAAGTPSPAPGTQVGEPTPPPAAAVPTPPSPPAAQGAAEKETPEAETPSAKLKRDVAAVNAHKAGPTPTPPSPPRSRPPRSAEPPRSPAAPKPAASPGKRKTEEDPDGTLPLTE